jgi:hypothetical protein
MVKGNILTNGGTTIGDSIDLSSFSVKGSSIDPTIPTINLLIPASSNTGLQNFNLSVSSNIVVAILVMQVTVSGTTVTQTSSELPLFMVPKDNTSILATKNYTSDALTIPANVPLQFSFAVVAGTLDPTGTPLSDFTAQIQFNVNMNGDGNKHQGKSHMAVYIGLGLGALVLVLLAVFLYWYKNKSSAKTLGFHRGRRHSVRHRRR